ncbi:MAG: hypothetical protein U5L45_07060 [Saprospiraceae bacterium]|nr:hypothetical protein [Saprospiraceae bacterium]
MVHFSALPKNEPHSLFLRERSERMVSSYEIFCNYLAYSSLRSQKRGMWFVFRAKP